MSAVQICNKALIHVGQTNNISSLTEAGEAANLCNQVYDENRKQLLRDHAWGFATVEETLNLTTTDPANLWTYEYAYPNNCLAFLHIVNKYARNMEPPKHKKGRSSAGATVIWTDESLAVGRFIANVDNPTLFDSGFSKVLALRIAVDICMPLTGDGRRQESLMQRAELAFQQATQADMAESSFEDLPDPDFIRVRG